MTDGDLDNLEHTTDAAIALAAVPALVAALRGERKARAVLAEEHERLRGVVEKLRAHT